MMVPPYDPLNSIHATDEEKLNFCSPKIDEIDKVLRCPIVKIKDLETTGFPRQLDYYERKIKEIKPAETDSLHTKQQALLEQIRKLKGRITTLNTQSLSNDFVASSESKMPGRDGNSSELSELTSSTTASSPNSNAFYTSGPQQAETTSQNINLPTGFCFGEGKEHLTQAIFDQGIAQIQRIGRSPDYDRLPKVLEDLIHPPEKTNTSSCILS